MTSWIRRGTQVGVLSAGLLAAGGTAANAACPAHPMPGEFPVSHALSQGSHWSSQGSHRGSQESHWGFQGSHWARDNSDEWKNGSGSGHRRGTGSRYGTANSGTNSGGTVFANGGTNSGGNVVGNGGNGGNGVGVVGIYNAPGSYSIINVGIGGNGGAGGNGNSVLSSGNITGGNFLSTAVGRQVGHFAH